MIKFSPYLGHGDSVVKPITRQARFKIIEEVGSINRTRLDFLRTLAFGAIGVVLAPIVAQVASVSIAAQAPPIKAAFPREQLIQPRALSVRQALYRCFPDNWQSYQHELFGQGIYQLRQINQGNCVILVDNIRYEGAGMDIDRIPVRFGQYLSVQSLNGQEAWGLTIH